MICEQFSECIAKNCAEPTDRCSKCRSESSDSNISSSENGRRYNLRNDKMCRVINFLIDGGVYVNENGINKCDRLYCVKDKDDLMLIYIEFKGTNVRHALEQLYDTARRHKKEIGNGRYFFRAICKGAPKIGNDSKCIEIKKRMLREFDSFPVVKENEINEKISEFTSK